MGVFKQSIELNICNGILVIPLQVKAVAVVKSPSPTDPSLKFPPIKADRTTCTTCYCKIVIVVGKKDEFITNDVDPIDIEEFEKRKTHHNQYVEYIRASHAARVQKKVLRHLQRC